MGSGKGKTRRAQATSAITSRVSRQGNYQGSGYNAYRQRESVKYRMRGGVWEVQRTTTLETPYGDDFQTWLASAQKQAGGFVEATVELEVEHGYYDETYHNLIVTGWRPADASEVKKIERNEAKKKSKSSVRPQKAVKAPQPKKVTF